MIRKRVPRGRGKSSNGFQGQKRMTLTRKKSSQGQNRNRKISQRVFRGRKC